MVNKDDTYAHAISQAVLAHNGGKLRPHLVIIEDREVEGKGAICSAAAVGSADKLIAMLLSLIMKVSEALGDTKDFKELKDPRKLIELMGSLMEGQEKHNFIKEA